MAYCGTVTLHDKDGVGRHTIRYGCMPEGDILGLRDRLVADVATLRSKQPELRIELLCDGAPEMWNLLEEGFQPKFGDDLHRLVDFYHLMEKLGAAAQVLEGSAATTSERLGIWKQALLDRDNAATDILKELIASGRDEGVGAVSSGARGDHVSPESWLRNRSHELCERSPAWVGDRYRQRGGDL